MSSSKVQNGATKAAPSPPIVARLNRTSPGGNGVKLASSRPANEETNPEKTCDQDDYTVLEQHIRFWDSDGDGIIAPWDTYRGFRELGFNLVFSILAMIIVNGAFSYPTRLAYSFIPDPLFRVYVHGVYKAKHGSTTGIYDSEGRFVGEIFDNTFAKWDDDQDGALCLHDLFQMMRANRDVLDVFGWAAAVFELGTTWLLIQKDGKVYKDDLRQVYDGSIFYRIRNQIQSGKGWDQGFGLQDLKSVISGKIASWLKMEG